MCRVHVLKYFVYTDPMRSPILPVQMLRLVNNYIQDSDHHMHCQFCLQKARISHLSHMEVDMLLSDGCRVCPTYLL
jgi:hypothetical protein